MRTGKDGKPLVTASSRGLLQWGPANEDGESCVAYPYRGMASRLQWGPANEDGERTLGAEAGDCIETLQWGPANEDGERTANPVHPDEPG